MVRMHHKQMISHALAYEKWYTYLKSMANVKNHYTSHKAQRLSQMTISVLSACVSLSNVRRIHTQLMNILLHGWGNMTIRFSLLRIYDCKPKYQYWNIIIIMTFTVLFRALLQDWFHMESTHLCWSLLPSFFLTIILVFDIWPSDIRPNANYFSIGIIYSAKDVMTILVEFDAFSNFWRSRGHTTTVIPKE